MKFFGKKAFEKARSLNEEYWETSRMIAIQTLVKTRGLKFDDAAKQVDEAMKVIGMEKKQDG